MDDKKPSLADLAAAYDHAIAVHAEAHQDRLNADLVEEGARLKMAEAKRAFMSAVDATKIKRPKKAAVVHNPAKPDLT